MNKGKVKDFEIGKHIVQARNEKEAKKIIRNMERHILKMEKRGYKHIEGVKK